MSLVLFSPAIFCALHKHATADGALALELLPITIFALFARIIEVFAGVTFEKAVFATEVTAAETAVADDALGQGVAA